MNPWRTYDDVTSLRLPESWNEQHSGGAAAHSGYSGHEEALSPLNDRSLTASGKGNNSPVRQRTGVRLKGRGKDGVDK